MVINGNYEYRGREEEPRYNNPGESNYYIGLESGIEGSKLYVSKAIYDKCASFKKGQVVNVDIDYNEHAQFNKMRVSSIKLVG